jgi:hypothetical protein
LRREDGDFSRRRIFAEDAFFGGSLPGGLNNDKVGFGGIGFLFRNQFRELIG